MRKKDIEAGMKQAIGALKEQTPGVQRPTYVYAAVVNHCYDEISDLHDDGYNFEMICRSLEESGLLPPGADANSFRKAWRRERARRERRGKTKHDTQKMSAADRTRDENENERIKGLAGTTVDTGMGRIVKHADGSFDF